MECGMFGCVVPVESGGAAVWEWPVNLVATQLCSGHNFCFARSFVFLSKFIRCVKQFWWSEVGSGYYIKWKITAIERTGW